MCAFYFKFLLIFTINSFVFCDITSPVNYQPIKYSHIHLEVNYVTNNGLVKKEFHFTQQNILLTVINSKMSAHVSGRLIVVKSDDVIDINSTIASRISNINGACSRITTISEVQWIALVLKGGKCSIKEKLDNVLRYSNASAVIILDSVLSKNNDRYEFNNNIGLKLNELLVPMSVLLNDSIFINASIIINNFFVDGFISRTSVLFVSISFILLMVISLVWLIFFYIQRFRYIHAKERLSRRLANAAKKALDKIPIKVLSTYDKEVSNDYDQCAICIDNYNVGETIRILPCKHIFHKVCIDSWLIEQRSCPMCKVDILKACGVLNVSSSGKTSLVSQGLWVSSATATATAALLDAELNDETLVIESLGSYPDSRCRRGHSTFLQRYRERYGLHHCHRGHQRHHFHKLSRHFQEHRCIAKNGSPLLPNVTTQSTEETLKNNQQERERADLISVSENAIINQRDTSLQITIPEDKDQTFIPKVTCKQKELHELSDGPVHDICDCSSDNTNGECDVCDRIQNNSTQASTTCSCETCSDCLLTNVDCDHYNSHRPSQGTGIGNLLTCCITSNRTLNNLPNNSIAGLYCCTPCSRHRSSTCIYCNNTILSVCNKRSSKSICPKIANCHNTSNLNDSLFSQSNPYILPRKSGLKNHHLNQNNCDNSRSLKSIIVMKNIDKGGTIDSYNKSTISDEFDYEADNGSSSIELPVPAMKLTVLPPQVQCHQGPTGPDCHYPTDEAAKEDWS